MRLELLIVLVMAVALIAGLTYYSLRPKQKPRTDSLYTNALNAMVRGDSRTALKYLRDVVKQDTDHIDAYLQMGDILRTQGNALQALKIHQSLTVRPKLTEQLRKDIHKSLALDYMENKQINKALREGEILLKLDKRNVWANEFLLNIAETQGAWDRATQLAKTIQKLNQVQDTSQLSRYRVFQGMEKLEKGENKDAEQHFLKAIKQSSEYGLPYLRLGDMYAKDRNLVKAIENWEKFALTDPDEGHQTFSKIESALFDLGRFSEVEKFYKRILDKNPGNLDALAKLANVLEEKGEHRTALGLIENALTRFKESIPLRLMKLKLSINVCKPHELGIQIDDIIELLTGKSGEK